MSYVRDEAEGDLPAFGTFRAGHCPMGPICGSKIQIQT